MRFVPYILSIVATVVFCYLAIEVSMWFYLGVGICGAGALLGTYDLIQTKHSLLRNYPLQAHLRFLAEELRPELMQYFIEKDTDGEFNVFVGGFQNRHTVFYSKSIWCTTRVVPIDLYKSTIDLL